MDDPPLLCRTELQKALLEERLQEEGLQQGQVHPQQEQRQEVQVFPMEDVVAAVAVVAILH